MSINLCILRNGEKLSTHILADKVTISNKIEDNPDIFLEEGGEHILLKGKIVNNVISIYECNSRIPRSEEGKEIFKMQEYSWGIDSFIEIGNLQIKCYVSSAPISFNKSVVIDKNSAVYIKKNISKYSAKKISWIVGVFSVIMSAMLAKNFL